MHGKSARTGAAHARAARASEGHGRALLPCAVLLALVALLIVPVRAYADANYRTVLWSGDYASGKQYIVGADNKYDAAAYICGQTSEQVAAYDLTVRYKLSATENDFAALADSLEKDWPGWNEDTLAQSLAETFTREVNGLTLWDVMTQAASVSAGGGVIFNQGALSLFQVKYWQDTVDCDIYAVDTTSDAVSRARDDLQEILSGGGGTGTGEMPSTLTFTMEDWVGKSNPTYQYDNRSTAEPLNATFTVDLSMVNNSVGQYAADNPYITYVWWRNGNVLSNFGWTLNVYMSPDAFATLDGNYLRYTFKVYNQFEFTNNVLGTVVNGDNNVSIDYAGRPTVIQNVQTDTFQVNNRNCYVKYVNINEPSGGGGDGGPGNWPDPPSNPTPPEPPTVPDPPQNPEPDPPTTPVAPTPPPLEPPTNVIIPTGTTPQDYTPWLRAILEQLQTLTDELAIHCVHLQEEMQTSVNELQDTLIYRFNSLESQIWDLFNGLEDYLHDLAAWLAEQLDFNVNVDPYDDNSVLYWLRQIYSRLGNLPRSPTTVMDPDPTEPFDFWAWLMNLIANTVGGIIGDLVGDVAGLLDLFKDKFPFSIPWDIAALLTLLDGTRATPAFDVKLAAVPGWWQETTFRIDLTPFDSVASACRTMVNILWVMVLVMKTDWMLAIMGDATSFGERFARKVARTS